MNPVLDELEQLQRTLLAIDANDPTRAIAEVAAIAMALRDVVRKAEASAISPALAATG